MRNNLLVIVSSAEVGRKSGPSDFAVEGWLLARGHQSLDRRGRELRRGEGKKVGGGRGWGVDANKTNNRADQSLACADKKITITLR